jgi:predicted transcriptional regulator
MKSLKTLAAIVDGVLVPPAEVEVLRTLVAFGRPASVPELAKSVPKERISDATFYSLLGRLAERRGLVTREERITWVEGSAFKRVFWTPNQASVSHFEMETKDDAGGAQRAPASFAT